MNTPTITTPSKLYQNYRYVTHRNPENGVLVTYVCVQSEHPYYGKHYDDVNITVAPSCGLSFSGTLRVDNCSRDRWWFGFDFMDEPSFDEAHATSSAYYVIKQLSAVKKESMKGICV